MFAQKKKMKQTKTYCQFNNNNNNKKIKKNITNICNQNE